MTWLFSRDTPQQLNLNTKGFATFQANTISISCVPHHPHHQVCFNNPYYSTGGHVIVTREGFEPSTHSLEGCCSIQLSYRASLNYYTYKVVPQKGFEPSSLDPQSSILSVELPGQVQINYTDIFSFKKCFEKIFQKYFKERSCNQPTIQLY